MYLDRDLDESDSVVLQFSHVRFLIRISARSEIKDVPSQRRTTSLIVI